MPYLRYSFKMLNVITEHNTTQAFHTNITITISSNAHRIYDKSMVENTDHILVDSGN